MKHCFVPKNKDKTSPPSKMFWLISYRYYFICNCQLSYILDPGHMSIQPRLHSRKQDKKPAKDLGSLESTRALCKSGLRSILKVNCSCAATIQVQYIQFLVLYQTVHIKLYNFYFKVQLIPTLSISDSQSQQNSLLQFFLHVFLYMHKQWVNLMYPWLNRRMLQIYIIVRELYLVDCSATLGGMAQFIIRVERESYFYPQNYYMLRFVRSRASSMENKWSTHALSLSSSPYPFPISLTYTHAHAHTLLTPPPSLSFIVTRNVRMGVLHSDGEMMTMAHYPLPERMDLIHSMLVCAYQSTDQLSWSACGINEIHLHHRLLFGIQQL